MSKVLVEFEAKQQELIAALERQKKAFVDLSNAEDKIEKTATSNYEKRKQRLKEEIQDLNELKKRRTQAFTPEDIEQYNKRIKETEKNIKNLQGNYGQLEKSNSRLGKSFQMIGSYIAGAFAVDRLIRFGREAIELAGKAEGVEQAFNRLNSPALLSELREATRGTISDLELMQAAVRAKNFKVPLENLGTYFEFATKRAAQTGESVDYLVNSIIDGIGRKSTLVLDNLGISATDLQAEMKKTGDFGQAAGNIITKSLEETGDVVETTTQKTARLNATLENQKVVIGTLLTPAWNEFLETVSFGLNQATTNFGAFNALIGDNLTWAEKFEIGWNGGATALNAVNNALEKQKEEMQAIASNRDFFFFYAKNREDLNKFTTAQLEQSLALKEYLGLQENEIKAIQDEIALRSKSTELSDKEIEALIKKAEAMWALRQATMETQKEIDKQLQQFDFTESQPQQEQGLPIFGIGLDNFEQEQDVMVDGFDKATEEMKELGISNMSEYFEYLKSESKDAQEKIKEIIFFSLNEVSQAFFDIQQAKMDIEAEQEQRRLERLEQMELSSLERRYNNEIQGKKLSDRRKVQMEQEYADRQAQIRADYEKKRLKEEAAAARKKKDLALAQAIINTALAVTEALASQNYAGAAYAAIQGGIEIAVIASTPVPEYAKGTEFLQAGPGQGKRKDDIPILANKGEAIIPTERNKQYPGLAKAWIDGNLDEYIFKQYSMPKIKEALQEIENQKSKDFASNVASAMILNFNDKNLIKELRKGSKESIYYLQQIAENKTRSTRHV